MMFVGLMQVFNRQQMLSGLLLGCTAAFGMPPHFAWYILLPALAALMVLVRKSASRWQAVRIGWSFGVGYFTVGLFWIAHAFVYQEEMALWVGYLAPIGLSFYLALFTGLCAALAWQVRAWSFPAYIYGFAAFWCGSEMLRGVLFTGFPWNGFAAGFVDVAASARIIGAYGMSGLVILLGGALLLLLKKNWTGAAVVLASPILLTLAGVAFTPTEVVHGKPIALHIVQPNIGQQDKYRLGYDEVNFTRLEQQTRGAGDARLVFWPEAAVPYVLETDMAARRKVSDLLNRNDVLLTGADSYRYGPNGFLAEAHNSIVVMNGTGDILTRYDKARLVPGGEYLPLRRFLEPLGLQNLAPGGDFDEGPGPRTAIIRLPGHRPIRAGFLICYEIIFPGAVFYGDKRPDFVFNPSNDAWFGAWQPPQHLAMARLRAIEQGIPVIRSTPTGISAIIDADGNVTQALPTGKAGHIAAPLPNSRRATLFAQFGNILAGLLAILFLAIAIALRKRLS